VLEVMAAIETYRQSKYPLTPAPSKDYWEDAEGIDSETMYRGDPSPLVSKKYINGNYFATFNFSYYSRSITLDAARHICESILDVLNVENFSNLFGATSGTMEVLSRPSALEKDDRGRITFVVSFSLKYYVEV